ncbi:conserved membrane hypothetical protein [Desulfosarcina cetonica]|uniref:hypothetical protein n=1 Tax=Desulfosarcina cetonica TaxID=90730 RepID=UPI0006CF7B40|nr:hypothetical protein [Desulfosarcina cetonica]VTR65215.1 conserved membrane hypothetical protein [Desulfosarcina cetonica]
MISGIQEILLILLIILGLFLVPRITARRRLPQQMAARRIPAAVLSRSLRLGIFLSLIWLAGCAIGLKPWQHDLTPFIIVGIGPVVLGWGIKWVLAGKKNAR